MATQKQLDKQLKGIAKDVTKALKVTSTPLVGTKSSGLTGKLNLEHFGETDTIFIQYQNGECLQAASSIQSKLAGINATLKNIDSIYTKLSDTNGIKGKLKKRFKKVHDQTDKKIKLNKTAKSSMDKQITNSLAAYIAATSKKVGGSTTGTLGSDAVGAAAGAAVAAYFTSDEWQNQMKEWFGKMFPGGAVTQQAMEESYQKMLEEFYQKMLGINPGDSPYFQTSGYNPWIPGGENKLFPQIYDPTKGLPGTYNTDIANQVYNQFMTDHPEFKDAISMEQLDSLWKQNMNITSQGFEDGLIQSLIGKGYSEADANKIAGNFNEYITGYIGNSDPSSIYNVPSNDWINYFQDQLAQTGQYSQEQLDTFKTNFMDYYNTNTNKYVDSLVSQITDGKNYTTEQVNSLKEYLTGYVNDRTNSNSNWVSDSISSQFAGYLQQSNQYSDQQISEMKSMFDSYMKQNQADYTKLQEYVDSMKSSASGASSEEIKAMKDEIARLSGLIGTGGSGGGTRVKFKSFNFGSSGASTAAAASTVANQSVTLSSGTTKDSRINAKVFGNLVNK